MGVNGGPNITNLNDLGIMFQPNIEIKNIKSNKNTTVTYDGINDYGIIEGKSEILDPNGGIYGQDIDPSPTIEIKNLENNIYNLNTFNSKYYTISLWVRIRDFPSKYAHENENHKIRNKRTSIVRFNYSSKGESGHKSGYIEFGAMAPYYYNINDGDIYKSVFEPISLGVSIYSNIYCQTVYTDYKFNLNKWYLMTFEMNTDSTFSNININFDSKIYINNTLELISRCSGIAWNQKYKGNRLRRNEEVEYDFHFTKRYVGRVAAAPGFINKNNKILDNGYFMNMTYHSFINLNNLNYISYSPIKYFNAGNGQEFNDGQIFPHETGNRNLTKQNTNIDFGQLYIYSNKFNESLYNNFNNLYK